MERSSTKQMSRTSTASKDRRSTQVHNPPEDRGRGVGQGVQSLIAAGVVAAADAVPVRDKGTCMIE
jgi:hypothetical protein